MGGGEHCGAELLTSLGREAVALGLVSALAGHLRRPAPTQPPPLATICSLWAAPDIILVCPLCKSCPSQREGGR